MIAAGPVVDLPLIKGEAIPDDVGVAAGLSRDRGFERVVRPMQCTLQYVIRGHFLCSADYKLLCKNVIPVQSWDARRDRIGTMSLQPHPTT